VGMETESDTGHSVGLVAGINTNTSATKQPKHMQRLAEEAISVWLSLVRSKVS